MFPRSYVGPRGSLGYQYIYIYLRCDSSTRDGAQIFWCRYTSPDESEIGVTVCYPVRRGQCAKRISLNSQSNFTTYSLFRA